MCIELSGPLSPGSFAPPTKGECAAPQETDMVVLAVPVNSVRRPNFPSVKMFVQIRAIYH